MLIVIAVGLLLAIVTIAIHTLGSSLLIGVLRKNTYHFEQKMGEIKALSMTAIGLLLIHIAETIVWAVVYLLAIGDDQLMSFEDAVYFSTVTFTTLGYGDIVIEGRWRMLCACQAMTGLLVFGWSTALLFAVVQRVWSRRLGEIEYS